MLKWSIIHKILVCKTDEVKECKAGSISFRLFRLKQIEVNNAVEIA